MEFEKVIDDLRRLKGLSLTSITPSTPPLVLVDINVKENKYFVLNKSGTAVGRSLNQLKEIWDALCINGFVNVDQALYGSGSSRNQPETLLAHLPYVQHFKYRHKKHLLLRQEKVHEFGELSELSFEETRQIKKKIDRRKSFRLDEFGSSLNYTIEALDRSLANIYEKYPGEAEVHILSKVIGNFQQLKKSIEDSVVTLDDFDMEHFQNTNQVNVPLESVLESPIILGVDDSAEGDDTDSSVDSEDRSNSSNKDEPPRVRRQTPTCALIYDRLIYKEIEIQPEYQRKDRIWSMEQRSRLIESILIGLPLPIFYFAERKNGNWAIIDGLQRITTIQDFMQDKFALEKLGENSKYNGVRYSELSRIETRKIREFELTAYVVDIEDGREPFITELFHRINTYGLKLSPQEIRTAIHLGSSVSYLKYLASSAAFVHATHGKVRTERQKDVELCLGAMSFMIFGFRTFNYNKYDDFLKQGMDWLNKFEVDIDANEDGTIVAKSLPDSLISLETRFLSSLEFTSKLFGEDAFKKELYSDSKAPVNKPLFELIVSVFSMLTNGQRRRLLEKKTTFFNEFFGAIESDSTSYATWDSSRYEELQRGFNYSISLSTGKKATVLYRFNSLLKMLEIVLGESVNFRGIAEVRNA